MRVAKKIGGVSISVAMFLAVRERCEASQKNVAILLYVAISWLFPTWLFSVAMFVAIRGYFLFFRGYLSVAMFYAWLFCCRESKNTKTDHAKETKKIKPRVQRPFQKSLHFPCP